MLQDIRYALRVLARSPGFAFVSVATIALGIGVNTAVFSVVNAYLLRPLPVKEPGEIVVIGQTNRETGGVEGASYPVYRDAREFTDVFAGVSTVWHGVVNFSSGGRSERSYVELVSTDYFRMLGVEAAIGRAFAPGEGERPGTAPVVVLSHGFWQRHFGGDPAAVGREVTMNGKPFTVVGVAPESFAGTEPMLAFDAYVPVTMVDQLYPIGRSILEQRGSAGFNMIARLRPGVEAEQAAAALDTLARRLEQEHPDVYKGVGFRVVPELRARPSMETAEIFPVVALSFSVLVGLVLLSACANVANLALSRAPARQREMALRAALGAGRGRLVRQVLTESVLLSLAGGAVGLALGVWATQWLSGVRLSSDIPFRFDLGLDWRVFAFTQCAALATGVAAGLVPALRASRTDLNEALRAGGKGTLPPGRHRLAGALVAAQVAVSLVLLAASGLFLRSLANAWNTDLGFRTENVLMSSFDLLLQGYDETRGQDFYRRVVERVGAAPGVRSVSLVSNVPLGFTRDHSEVFTGDFAGEPATVFNTTVGLDFFPTMGISLARGRDFTAADGADAPRVAVVNEAMARRFWPNEEAIGKRFRFGRDGRDVEVVGVAADVQYLALGQTDRPFFYLPLAQSYQPMITLVAHTAADPGAVAGAVREVVRELDPQLPLYNVTTMESHLENGQALLFVRLGAQLVGAFGLLGLALAVAGLYGVVAYSVSQRTHEIGIRMALGAEPSAVLAMVLREGLALALVGSAVGLALALALGRYLSSLLYGVGAADPLTLGAVTALLLGVAAVAAYVPAARAARVDPMVALKYE